MRYQVKLSIDYAYEAPSDHTRNLLRLLPCEIPGRQRVTLRLLTIEPSPDERREWSDFFGNAASSIAWHAPLASVALTLTAHVERIAVPEPLDFSPRLSTLAAEMSAVQTLSPLSPHHFLGASPRVAPMAETTAFACDLVTPEMTALDAVVTIGRALHAEMAFDAEATDVDTTPAQAFAQRRGVCQDFTHVMIAALRGIGIPAGYVSGFLRTFPPPGQPRLEGSDAMHAWVRAWVGQDMGWIEFDPTNNQHAGIDYITVAYGRDYSDVAPVRGALRSSGTHESRQAVDVIPLDES